MTQLVPSLTVTDRIRIRRMRELPVKGTGLLAVGDLVDPRAVVCRGEIPGEIVVVSPCDELGLDHALLKDGYRVAVGDRVERGAVLVSTSTFFGLIRSQVASPIDGTIAFITSDQGRIGVQLPPTVAERIAYCGGRVLNVEESGATELESDVALVQGIFGVGGERVGVLRILPCALDERPSESQIPMECNGQILVGGMDPDCNVLQLAARRGAVGFVCASVSAQALQGFVGTEIGVAVTGDEPVTMSLVITEGFGSIPMSPRAHAVLAARAGSVAAINGTTQVRAGAVRPEVLIPLPLDGDVHEIAEQLLPELKVGSRVRLIRYPYFGSFGTVAELPDQLHTIETGAAVRVLHAQLDDGQRIVVPRANIELLS